MTAAEAVSKAVDQIAAAMDRTQLQISQHQASTNAHVAEIKKNDFAIAELERSMQTTRSKRSGSLIAASPYKTPN